MVLVDGGMKQKKIRIELELGTDVGIGGGRRRRRRGGEGGGRRRSRRREGMGSKLMMIRYMGPQSPSQVRDGIRIPNSSRSWECKQLYFVVRGFLFSSAVGCLGLRLGLGLFKRVIYWDQKLLLFLFLFPFFFPPLFSTRLCLFVGFL
ncbi:hypothetical protein BGX38DRAFT_39111 [Terfezia claveryi]|nr:hypothetical protein BGX38DRAFT_39111 [Terfezia claveryi]